MRTAILGLVLTALVIPIGPAAAQGEAAVSVVDSVQVPLLEWTFSPGNVTVEAGGSVTWTSFGFEDHTVTAEDGAFAAEVRPNRPLTLTFSTPGTFAYFCTPHPWMKGTVTVLPAAGTADMTTAADEEPAE
jgi:plastocyanin